MSAGRWRRTLSLAVACAAALRPHQAIAGDARERAVLIARWSAANHRSAATLERHAAVPPPAILKALVAAELATRGRYQLTPQKPRPARTSPWLQFLQWVRDRWNDLWHAAFGRVHLGRGGAVAAGDLLIIVVALLLLFIGYRLASNLAIERRAAARARKLDEPRDAAALYATACDFARSGDYARASAALFSAAVIALSARDIVRDDRSATVGDLRRTLRRESAELVGPFDEVAAAFVTGVYAERPLARDDWERALTGYRSLAADVPA